MAGKKPPAYDSEGFEAAHQPRGLSPSARKFLEDKGALTKPEPGSNKTPSKAAKTPRASPPGAPKPPKKPAATSGSKSSRKKPPDDGGDLEGELPRRSRKARALQARHFRFPREIDAKLQDLVDYHEGTMVWVISMLVQNEWVRTRRALRERQPAAGDEVSEAPGKAGPDSAEIQAEKPETQP
jgi:hypothetical protein